MMNEADKSGRTYTYVVFMAGGYEFLVSIDSIERIAGADQCREEIPVLDFDRLLRGDDGQIREFQEQDRRHILIISAEEVRFGLLVRNVTEIRELREEEELPLDRSVLNAGNRYLRGAVYRPKDAPDLAYRIDAVQLYHMTTGEGYDTDETTA